MSPRRVALAFGLVASLALVATAAHAAATINIINLDGPGEGFNDPTPAAPVGGNPGTTIGEQRLRCFERAAQIWGAILTSPVPINIQAAFNPLTCTATSATLGSAGTRFAELNNPAFEFQGYWYNEALANKQAGTDLTPPTGTDNGSDINAQFNSNIGTTGCLTSSGWYYGFDHNEGTKIDLIAVLLHEFAHGLGFQTLTSGSTGNPFNGFPALWDKYLYDETTGLHWDQMTAAQRVASAINTNNLVWDGAIVKAAGGLTLARASELAVPFGTGSLAANVAGYGPALTSAGVSGQAVIVVDATAPTGDGCEAMADLTGKIAVIDRGVCSFAIKTKNAQNAGAIGVILVNNTTGTFSPSGTDATIVIPTVAITQADGTLLKNAIAAGPVNVSLRLSPTQRAGIHPSGRIRMYAPNPFQSGSSVSHYDVSLTPNALMEPAINGDLTDSVDLTEALFREIGWLPRNLAVPGGVRTPNVALASTPNPSREGTRVHFELASEEQVELSIHDLAGRRIRTLVQGRLGAGAHDLSWDGRDASGRMTAPGVYLARLQGPRTHASQHVVRVQ